MRILNIGLRTIKGDSITSSLALELVRAKADGGAILAGTYTSETEPTAVIVAAGLRNHDVHRIAVDLQQDCIAVYDTATDVGYLIGPNADVWGAFTPQYFIGVDGRYMGARAKVAA